jgi:anaerobic selenocysteine-containing dehydrogenase
MDRPASLPGLTYTTCRVCEAACGLIAAPQPDGTLRLAPDPDHPVSRGYACRKGTTYAQRVQEHPDRVLRPRLRGAEGWREVSWDEALAETGRGLREALARDPDSVGLYTGNAVGHSLGATLGATALQRALGTRRHYSCLTLDNSEMFVVAEAVFGHPLATFVADYEGSDLVLLVGTDPLSSQASQAQSHPQAGHALRQRARAGQLVVIDPRRSVTAQAASLHLAPRLASDVFLLAWLLREALAAGRWDGLVPEAERAALHAAVAPYDLARTARVTGITPADLQGLRDRLLSARRPLVWSGLGVLLGPHGTLGWWLTVCLQAVLGGLDVPGGWQLQPGAVDLLTWGRRLGLRARNGVFTSTGWQDILGTLPAATLADDILQGRLRALVVLGGDPLSSLPDSDQAARALRSLDLLVCVDLFESPTARLAHALLPAATWLERDETGLLSANQRPAPHLRLDRAVLPPRGEARTDFDIAMALCRAAGRAPWLSRLATALGPTALVRTVAALSGVPLAEVTSARGHSPPPARDLLRRGHPALRRPQLAVPAWTDALAALPDPAPGLRLLTSVRPLSAMNHWLRPGDPPQGSAHPDDLPSPEGGRVRIVGPGGERVLLLRPDPTLARGTVVLPYGDPRANPNALIGTTELEPFSGQPWSNGAWVVLHAL